jgi:predicted metal-dependent hydrolase
MCSESEHIGDEKREGSRWCHTRFGTVGAVEVEVVRSAKRKRTVQARMVGDKLRVSIPASMTRADEKRWVDEMVRRLTRRHRAEDIDLNERAAGLARRYRLPVPDSIRWVENQQSRWGSCTPSQRTIRISSQLAAYPSWVLDYVLVHELAHLVEAGHGPAFKALVARYPKAERAIGFLLAKGIEGDEPEPVERERPAPIDLREPARLPGF